MTTSNSSSDVPGQADPQHVPAKDIMGALDYNRLGGPEKAAIFLFSLQEDQSKALLQRLDESEIREISYVMSNLGTIKAEAVERIFVDFTGALGTHGSLHGNFENTERLLSKVLDKKAVETIMDDIRGPEGRTIWDKLSNVNRPLLVNYLHKEHPQTIALILARINPRVTADVLALFERDLALDIMQRMLRVENVQKEAVKQVEETLRTQFMAHLAHTSARDPHQLIAEVFNNFDSANEKEIMADLEERDEESAKRVKSLMFTFTDVTKLDPVAIQTILRDVDKAKLAVALKGASEQARELFFGNMSARVAKLLREDMEALGPVRLREVDAAQGYIAESAKALAAKGDIVIAVDADEDTLVY